MIFALSVIFWFVLLFCSKFFQSFIPSGKSIPSQLYWLMKGLIFDILPGWFSMFSWFNATVIEYWKHLSLFSGFIELLFYLLPIQEILCMIFLFTGLFYEHDKTIYQHFQIQNQFHFSILSLLFGNYLRMKKSFNNVICFITRPNFVI